MAEQSNSIKTHRVWTYLLLSGPPIQMTLPGNPELDFQGRRTIWKIVASQEVADYGLRLFESLGIKVQLFTEEENDEMKAEREKYQTE